MLKIYPFPSTSSTIDIHAIFTCIAFIELLVAWPKVFTVGLQKDKLTHCCISHSIFLLTEQTARLSTWIHIKSVNMLRICLLEELNPMP